MKSHPMVLNIACQSVEFHCAVLQRVGAEIPYAVVPADASRWGLIEVSSSVVGFPYAVVPAVASRWGPSASVVNGPVVVSHLLAVEEVVVILGVVPLVNDVLVVIVVVVWNGLPRCLHQEIRS